MVRACATWTLLIASASALAYSLPDPAEWWMGKSDEYVWQWIPDLKVQGIAHGSDWNCPFCGDKIFEGRGHYPWRWHPDRPYKIQCPVCDRIFPTNDYHKWVLEGRKGKLDTTRKFVDDGQGYVGPSGTVYPFVKYAIGEGHKPSCWVWVFSKGIPALAAKYGQTGEAKYARRCALIMARIATEYPDLNPEHVKRPTLEQVRRMPYRRPPRGAKHAIAGYQVECPNARNTLRAYRRIYPYLEKGGDAELRTFLASKGVEDVRSLIQYDLCQEMIIGALEGNYVSGSGIQGLQDSLVAMAKDWDLHDPSQGVTTEYILEWVLESGPIPVAEWMYNCSDRDGMGCCEGLGYSFSGGIAKVCPLARQLREAGVDIYARPRIQQIIRAPLRPIVAGKWYPSIGDGGSWRGFRAGRYCRASWMGPLVADYDDVLVARALARFGQGLGPYREKVEALTATHGRDIQWQSRVLGPFGLAIVESGTGDHRRGLTCYYGGNTAHGHFDRLTISLFNRDGPVTPDLGYPHMGFGERSMRDNNTVSHTTVVVNARKQLNREPGYLTTFTVAPTAKALEVGGEAAYRGIVSRYKRTLIWVDVDEHNSYLVDVFRVAGGAQHDYSVHGASADVSVRELKLSAQEGGTLAGPDVEYRAAYDSQPRRYQGSGFSYLFDVERGAADRDFVATWNRRRDAVPALRVHVPTGQAEQALLANCVPPFGKPHESALRYLFLRNGSVPPVSRQADEHASADLRSTFVTVMEPVSREPFIRRVRRADRGTGLGESDVGLEVERTDGATDLVVCLEDAGSVEVGGVSMQGRIGLCTMGQDASIARLALLDGTRLCRGDTSIGGSGPIAGTVVSVDYDRMTVVVRESLPPGDALAGRKIIFTTPPRTACFTIRSVSGLREGSQIKLRELDAIACYSKVEGASTGRGTVTLNSAISIYHSGTALAGMRLYNEDRSVGVKIKRFDRRWDPNSPWPPFGGAAHVEGSHNLRRAFTDRDDDGKTMAWVYEFGPGDRYRITSCAYLARER